MLLVLQPVQIDTLRNFDILPSLLPFVTDIHFFMPEMHSVITIHIVSGL